MGLKPLRERRSLDALQGRVLYYLSLILARYELDHILLQVLREVQIGKIVHQCSVIYCSLVGLP